MRYISLLRGINVSGQKKIKMAALRAAYERAGLTNVRSYLQSGNVLFDTRVKSSVKVEEKIHLLIAEEWGFDVTVFVRPLALFDHIVENHPFVARAADPKHLHVTFLASEPTKAAVDAIVRPAGDDVFEVDGAVVYLFCSGGYGRTKLNNKFFERKLGMAATTRNWRSVGQLRGLAEA